MRQHFLDIRFGKRHIRVLRLGCWVPELLRGGFPVSTHRDPMVGHARWFEFRLTGRN